MNGDTWTLAFEGETGPMRDLLGFWYLAHLIANPEREIPATNLAAIVSGKRLLASAGTTDHDKTHIKEIHKRLEDAEHLLETAIASNDGEGAERLKATADELKLELSRVTGNSGKLRRTNDDVERFRVAISNAIAWATKKLSPKMPRLARHLRRGIRRGRSFCYRPETPVDWVL
jgi:hypothetical protein